SFSRIAWGTGSALGDVRQESQLAGPLDSGGELVLVPAAAARDAARADLALVGQVAPQGREVLVLDLVDLVPAEVTALSAPAGSGGRLGAPAAGGGAALLCQLLHLPASLSGNAVRGARRRGTG